jgi:hypothetical protein
MQVFLRYGVRDLAPMLLLAMLAMRRYRALRSAEGTLLLSLFVVQCAYSVYIGGDYAEPLRNSPVNAANRFITQGMPFLFVLFAVAVEQTLGEIASKWRALDLCRMPVVVVIVLGVSGGALAQASGPPWLRWVRHNAPMLDSDIWRARLGLHIQATTSPNAVIAVHAAGQIPYYSRRRTIDLLGKSDAIIAHGAPAAPFRPGHNKWNYAYSIGQLAPDLVADPWGQSNAYLSTNADYIALANGIYVRADSLAVERTALGRPY